MNIRRSWAVFLRYFYVFSKFDQLADLFYWPTIDIFLWGMTSVWLQTHEGEAANVSLVILSGLIFWQIVWRSNYEVGVNLLYEFWNRNLVNMFSTPLRLRDWIGGIMLVSLFKIALSLSFGALLVFFLYKLNVFVVGWQFLPFGISLLISGWWIGFLAASIVIYWGQRLQMLAWMTAYIFAPFSAVMYPVSALPSWAQTISWYLPTTYVFEGMRKILAGEPFPLKECGMSFGLNVVYFALALTIFNFMFEKSRQKGFARLE